MSLLEQDNTRKRQKDKELRYIEFDAGNNDSGKYKVKAIWDSAIYARESQSHLSRLYNLVSWKKYLEDENTWESASAIQHFKKLICSFHKDYLDQSIVTSEAINTA